jgi:hypothetical protein
VKQSDEYREKALRLCQRANAVPDLDLKVEYEALAFTFMCLAEQVDSEMAEWAECRDLDCA